MKSCYKEYYNKACVNMRDLKKKNPTPNTRANNSCLIANIVKYICIFPK